jgi:RF-1 domain
MSTHDPITTQRQSHDPAWLHPARLDSDALAAECDFRATRRSGPGGQNRNKVETAVILTHRPTGIIAEASERRTQGENRRAALFRLRLKLALHIRRTVGTQEPSPYQPSDLWRRRCRGGRIVINPEHDDFPALLAEALDVLAETGNDPKRAALALGCSPSQLMKLLKDEPRGLGVVNDHRRQAGLHPLQ